MIKTLLTLFFIGHVIGDFYFQSSKLAKRKDEFFVELLRHSSIYFVSMILVITPVFSINLFKWVVLISVLHFLVDLIKALIKKQIVMDEKTDVKIYVVDQIIHVFVIVSAVIIIGAINNPLNYIAALQVFEDNFQINMSIVFSWILAVLIIIQPVSITIKKVLYCYKTTAMDEESGHPNAGSLIGILERSIILLMLSVNQYAAIGFVLTAKSIARYNKIADDPKFSEYYLLGTLLSTMLVIATYVLVF